MTEATVTGGGPAGLSAALGLLRRGMAVTVFERRGRWAGRVCGAFLSPEAMDALDWLELGPAVRAAGVPVSTARLFDGDRETVLPLDTPGLALPRRSLEDLLRHAVERAGGRVLLGEPGPPIPSVLAAGRSPAASGAGAFRREGAGGWYGWNALFSGAPRRPGDMSLHFHDDGYVGVLTFADGDTNVCGLFRREGLAAWEDVFQRHMDLLPSLRRALAGARRASDWRGVGPLPFGRRPWPAASFPAGDAAAVGDPFLGEGLGRALWAGPQLFEAWGDARPHASYRRLWERRFRRRILLSPLSRALIRRKSARKLLIPLLSGPLLPRFLSHLRTP